MSLARATISGTLISEPEKRFTPNNIAVTNFTIQVSPSGAKEVPFTVRVTCWRNLADVVAENLHKGDEAVIEGRLQVHQYEAPGGIAKRTYEVDATNVYIGQLQPLVPVSDNQGGGNNARPQQQSNSGQQDASYARGGNQGGGQQVPVGAATRSASANDAYAQEDLLTEDDIPF